MSEASILWVVFSFAIVLSAAGALLCVSLNPLRPKPTKKTPEASRSWLEWRATAFVDAVERGRHYRSGWTRTHFICVLMYTNALDLGEWERIANQAMYVRSNGFNPDLSPWFAA